MTLSGVVDMNKVLFAIMRSKLYVCPHNDATIFVQN